jgi:hypothetical protein
MMETPIVLVLREMLRPETGVSARGAGVQLAEALVEVAAEARVAVLRPRGGEEVLEEEVGVAEVPRDVEAQAIAATLRAAGAEAEIADAEPQRGLLVGVEKSGNHKKAAKIGLQNSTLRRPWQDRLLYISGQHQIRTDRVSSSEPRKMSWEKCAWKEGPTHLLSALLQTTVPTLGIASSRNLAPFRNQDQNQNQNQSE